MFDLETKNDDGDGSSLPTEIKAQFDKVMVAVTEMRSKNDETLAETKKGFADVVRKEELKRINDAVDTLKKETNDAILKLKKTSISNAASSNLTPEQKEYSEMFEKFMRKGEDFVGGRFALQAAEQKALQTQSNPDGGYTARPELETAIDEVMKEVSPIRQLATVRQIGSNSYKKLVSQRGTNSGWVGESDTRPQTLTSQLSELEYPTFELYAMPAATQTMLEDAYFNIDSWMADEVAVEFAQREGAAFVSGDGNKKPRGFLAYPNVTNASYSWGNIGYIGTGVSGDWAATAKGDALLQLIYAVKKGYRDGSSFITSRGLLGEIRQFKDAQNNYIAGPRLSDNGIVDTLFSFPLTEAEDMPAKAVASLSIAFGNWKRGYLIIDRRGVLVLRDPYTAKPYVLFYTTKRVGGGVQNFEAIKLLRFA